MRCEQPPLPPRVLELGKLALLLRKTKGREPWYLIALTLCMGNAMSEETVLDIIEQIFEVEPSDAVAFLSYVRTDQQQPRVTIQ